MGHPFIYPAVLRLPRGMLYFMSYSFTIRRGYPSTKNPLMNPYFLQCERWAPELGKPSRLGWPGCPESLTSGKHLNVTVFPPARISLCAFALGGPCPPDKTILTPTRCLPNRTVASLTHREEKWELN